MQRQGLDKEVQSEEQPCVPTDSLWSEVEIEAQLLNLGHKSNVSSKDSGLQLWMKMPVNFSKT